MRRGGRVAARGLAAAAALLVMAPHGAVAQVHLSALVEDGMVIQRGAEVPIEGRTAPGAEVVVRFDGEQQVTHADGAGSWRVLLPPRPAGGPYELVVEAAGERRVVRDILVGDVWVASGQSNMEWPVGQSLEAAREVAGARDSAIRNFRVPKSWSWTPEDELAGGAWEVSDAEHVAAHSAVAYFFARSLRDHVDVPIGIIDNSWGGARVEPFMSREALGLDEAGAAALVRDRKAHEARIVERLRKRIGGLPEDDRGMADGRAVWADPELDDSDWATISVPSVWEPQGYEGLNGVAWYRRGIRLTPEEAARPARLSLGPIDDSDITWVNGVEVGRMENAYSRPREYLVPAEALRPGENVIAVRVEDTGGGGGIYGGPELLHLTTREGRRPLTGDWRFRVGAVEIDFAMEMNQVPTVLYNRMVHPLTEYPIRGVIWYQGESNAYPQQALEYRDLFRSLIRGWREAWGQPELPFLWVQLANFMEPGDGTTPSDWAVLRESQSAALSLPHTAEAIAIDVGEADDIHPRNKQDVGARLALAARGVAYGHEDVVYSGPRYRDHETAGDSVMVTFDHVGTGLVTRGGEEPGGFVIAGRDGRFVRARARIEGDRVVVWSPSVPEPVAVRYAWADNPVAANLYNREGLPAAPFRTDRPER